MQHPPVNNVRFGHARGDGLQAAVDLGNHAALDDSLGDALQYLFPGQSRNQLAVLSQHSRHIGKQDQLAGF